MMDETGASTGGSRVGGSWRDHRLQFFGDDLAGAEDLRTPIEFHPDRRHARRDRGAHAAHARGAIHRGFDGKGDQRFDFLGGHAVGIGQNRHLWRVEIGEHIHRQAAHDEQTREHDEQRGQKHDQPLL